MRPSRGATSAATHKGATLMCPQSLPPLETSPIRLSPDTEPPLYAKAIIAAGTFLVLFVVLSAWYARHLDWNAMRLAPAAAALNGERIYPGYDVGVVTGHIYPPLGALAFSPIAWLPDISLMMSAGSLLAFAYFVLPLVLLGHFVVREAIVSTRDTMAILIGALLLAVFDVRLRYAAVMIHAEAPAVGLAALAMILAAWAGPESPRCWLWSGVFAAAAVAAKQTLVPTAVALGCLALCSGGRSVRDYATGTFAAGAICTAYILIREDWASFIYNCIWIPGHHPWNTREFSFAPGQPPNGQSLAERGRALVDAFLYLASSWWPAFVGAAWSLHWLWRGRFRAASPLTRTAAAAAFCALFQFPLALPAFLKVGGDVNALDPFLNPLLLMLVALALAAVVPGSASRAAGRRIILAAIVVLLACNIPRFGFLAGVALQRPEPNRAMVSYLRAHPGEVYLPWNPLHSWVAERRRDHFEYGVFDRLLAGRPVPEHHYRAHLPPRLRYIAFRKSQSPALVETYRQYLTTLTPAPSPAGLEDWMFLAVSEATK